MRLALARGKKTGPAVMRSAAGRLRYGARGRSVRFVGADPGGLTQGYSLSRRTQSSSTERTLNRVDEV